MISAIVKILEDVLGLENLQSFTNMTKRVKERSVENQNEQSVSVVFNKGNVRHINGSDNVNGVKPKSYTPE